MQKLAKTPLHTRHTQCPTLPSTHAQCFLFSQSRSLARHLVPRGNLWPYFRLDTGRSRMGQRKSAKLRCWCSCFVLTLAHVGTYWHPPWSPTTSADIAVAYNDTNGAASSNQGSTKGQCMQDMMFSLPKQLVLQFQNHLHWCPKEEMNVCLSVLSWSIFRPDTSSSSDLTCLNVMDVSFLAQSAGIAGHATCDQATRRTYWQLQMQLRHYVWTSGAFSVSGGIRKFRYLLSFLASSLI